MSAVLAELVTLPEQLKQVQNCRFKTPLNWLEFILRDQYRLKYSSLDQSGAKLGDKQNIKNWKSNLVRSLVCSVSYLDEILFVRYIHSAKHMSMIACDTLLAWK